MNRLGWAAEVFIFLFFCHQLLVAKVANSQRFGGQSRHEEPLPGTIPAYHKATFSTVVPTCESRELSVGATHADIGGFVRDPGCGMFRWGLLACLGQHVPNTFFQVTDPFLPLGKRSRGNNKGFLGRLNHPTILHLQGVWQRFQCDLIKGDDVLGTVLPLVDHDASVHQDVIEEEENPWLGFLATFFG